jgi:hypothetical protein
MLSQKKRVGDDRTGPRGRGLILKIGLGAVVVTNAVEETDFGGSRGSRMNQLPESAVVLATFLFRYGGSLIRVGSAVSGCPLEGWIIRRN